MFLKVKERISCHDINIDTVKFSMFCITLIISYSTPDVYHCIFVMQNIFVHFRRRSDEALDKWIATRKNGRQAINFVQVNKNRIWILRLKSQYKWVARLNKTALLFFFKFIDTGQWIEVFSDGCRRQTTNISKDFVATVVNCLRTLTFSR